MNTTRPGSTVALLSALAAVLTIIVVVAGLIVPGFYEAPTQELLLGIYAQDLVALPLAIALLLALGPARRGSWAAVMVWAGSLGYLVYGYTLFSFDRVFTALYPAYIAIMSLSIFSLILLLGGLDAAEFRRQVRPGMPVRLIAVVLFSPAILIVPWIAGLVEAVASGVPSLYNGVVVLDLGLLIPACLAAAIQIWRRQTWGFILSGVLLVKAASLCWSLTLGMLYYQFFVGPHPDLIQLPFYAFVAVVGAIALVGYLRHLGPSVEPARAVQTPPHRATQS